MLRLIGSALSPAGRRGRLVVLNYHRVLNAADPMMPGEVDVARFDWQMRVLREWFNVLPLAEAAARMRDGTLPSRAACITFDDGYANNLTNAAAVLERYRLPATVFVAVEYLDGGRMWNDTVIESVRRLPGPRADLGELDLGTHEIADFESRRRLMREILARWKYLDTAERNARAAALAGRIGAPLPADLMLTSRQLRELAARGVDIGAHTLSHPILMSIPQRAAEAEIAGSRERLAGLLDREITAFAYPNGRPGEDYGPEHVAVVRRSGYSVAVTTSWGSAGRNDDPLQLPRILPWDRSARRFALRLIGAYRQPPAAVV